VQSLLTSEALQRIGTGPYYFCPDSACNVVYFDANGVVFTQESVRVPVSQKVGHEQRPLCYCFGELEADIRREFAEKGFTLVIERVRTHIAAGRCACDLRNPSGKCCLAEVRAMVDRLRDGLS